MILRVIPLVYLHSLLTLNFTFPMMQCMTQIIYSVILLFWEYLFFCRIYVLMIHLVSRVVFALKLITFLLVIFFPDLALLELKFQLVHQLLLWCNHKHEIALELQEAITNFLIFKQHLHLWMNVFFLLKTLILSLQILYWNDRAQAQIFTNLWHLKKR